MGTTNVLYGKEAREKMNEGVQKLVKAVSSTLGANGSNVTIVDNFAPPRITKDGVTVAKSVMLYDYVENAGANIVRQAAISSANKAGDGTTTSTVLAGAILEEGINAIENSNKFDVRKGMSIAVNKIVEHLNENSKQLNNDIETLSKIATISANNNEDIGKTIAETIIKVGVNSPIIISKEIKDKNEVISTMGYTYYKPLINEYLTQIQGDIYSKLENAKLLIVDSMINRIEEILPVLKYLNESKIKLVIMTNGVSNTVMQMILRNVYAGNIDLNNFSIVETPNYIERKTYSLIDITRCTGAKLFSVDSDETSLNNFKPSDLGNISFFEATADKTTIMFDESGIEMSKQICSELKEGLSKISDLIQKDRIEERIQRLSGGMATIFISAKTEAEHSELYDLYEDSLKASMSAIEEGIVDGGGLALFRAVNEISFNEMSKDEMIGAKIIIEACKKPIKNIISNSGKNVDEVLKKIENKNFKFGFNAKTGEIVDMFENGIIDPKKVTRIAIESALSSATTILTTDTVIYPYDFQKNV